MDEIEVREMFFSRRTDKMIVGKRITDKISGQRLRIASHVMQGEGGLKFATIKDEIVLRETPAGRYEVKATFLEDDRSIRTLTLQKYSSKTGPLDKQYVTLRGGEIDAFLNFVAGVRTVPLDEEGKVHVSDDALKDIVLNEAQARKLFSQNEALFSQIAQSEELTRDLIAVGYDANNSSASKRC
jgi:hypothetical protein